MPRFLITQFSVAEYGFEVEAEDEAHQKVADDHEDVEDLEDGNPIAWHDCYSYDSTIEEIKNKDLSSKESKSWIITESKDSGKTVNDQ